MSTKSYLDLDPDMAELFWERGEHDRKQRELNNRPNLLISLTHDDNAELITAIIPDEDGGTKSIRSTKSRGGTKSRSPNTCRFIRGWCWLGWRWWRNFKLIYYW